MIVSARITSATTREAARPAALLRVQAEFSDVHHFYDQLCPSCGGVQLRGSARETADLRGRVALLTGGRVKIGYQAGIKLLRAGARLIVTTRFPRDAARATRASPTSTSGAIGSRCTGSTSGTRRASRRSATTSTRRATGSTSSSTTRARPCAGRPAFYEHMMELETASLRADAADCSALRAARRSAMLRDDEALAPRGDAVADARCSRASSPQA